MPLIYPVGFLKSSIQSVAFTDSAIDLTDSVSTYTFTSKAIGAAATNRVVVVCMMSLATSNNSFTGGTIGGVTATLVGSITGTASNDCITGMMYAVVPTGTTATVVVNLSSSTGQFRCQIAVYALNNLSSSTPVASQTTTTNNSAMSLSPGTGVIGVGASTDQFSSNPTYTWTNLTKDLDTAGEGANERYSSASAYNASGISSVTANASATTNFSAICATWT